MLSLNKHKENLTMNDLLENVTVDKHIIHDLKRDNPSSFPNLIERMPTFITNKA